MESLINGSNAKKQNSSSSSRMQPKEEAEESLELEKKIRCPCGSEVPCGGQLVQVKFCVLLISSHLWELATLFCPLWIHGLLR